MAQERHTTSIDIQVDDRQVVALGEEIERAFSSKVIEQFNSGLERQTKALQELLKEHKKLSVTQDRSSKDAWKRKFERVSAQGSGGDRAADTGGVSGRGVFKDVALGVVVGNAITGAMRRAGAAGAALFSGQGVTQQVLAALPFAGGPLAGAAGAAQTYYGEYAGRQIAKANAYGATRMTGAHQTGAVKAALAAGMMGDEGVQMTSEMAQQTGMVGGKLANVLGPGRGQGGLGGLFQMSQFGGVRNAGQMIGAAGVSGDEMGSGRAHKLMFDAVGSGLVAGLRESRLDQFVQGIGTFVEDSRTRGIRIAPETILTLTRGVAGAVGVGKKDTSMQGETLQNFVVNLSRTLGTAGEGTGLFDMLAMEGLGVTGKDGGIGVLKGLKLRETDEGLKQMFTHIIDTFREGGSMGGDMDLDRRAFAFRDMLKEQGVPLSYTNAIDLLSGGETAAAVDTMMGTGMGTGKRWLGGRKAEGTAISETKMAEASFKEERIVIGGLDETISAVAALRKTDLESARSLLPILTEVVKDAAEFIEEAVKAMNRALGKNYGNYKSETEKHGEWVYDLFHPDFDAIFGEEGKSGARRNDPYFDQPEWMREQKSPGHFNLGGNKLKRPEGLSAPKLNVPIGEKPEDKATSAADQLTGAAAALYALAQQLGETPESDLS